jgi:hypothetical protein
LGGRAYGGDPTAVGVLDCTTIDYHQLLFVCAGGERARIVLTLKLACQPYFLLELSQAALDIPPSKPPVCRAFA